MINIKDKLKNTVMCLSVLFLYFSLSYILSYMFYEAFASNNNVIRTTSLILGNLFILLIITLFFLPKLVDDAIKLSKDNLKIAYKNWLLGIVIMYLSNFIILFFNKDLAANEATNRAILQQAPVYAVIVMVIIAPILEELIFRLSFRKIFNNRFLYCLFSGLLFGMLHLTSLKEILFLIPYGSLGFFFAKTLYDTDNIFAPIITHITHNAMIIFMLILGSIVGV